MQLHHESAVMISHVDTYCLQGHMSTTCFGLFLIVTGYGGRNQSFLTTSYAIANTLPNPHQWDGKHELSAHMDKLPIVDSRGLANHYSPGLITE